MYIYAGFNDTADVLARKYGNLIVQRNSRNQSCLHLACKNGKLKTAQVLCNYGAMVTWITHVSALDTFTLISIR
jgi:hypothetical protein